MNYPRIVYFVRDRLKERGLWSMLEEIALQHHVPPLSILGRYDSKPLTAARHAFYVRVVLDEQIMSSAAFAKVIDRNDHYVAGIIRKERQRREETDRVFDQAQVG